MAYIGNTPAENYASFLTETFTVSATTNYTLSHAVTNENDIRLVINGVVQQPGSGKAYTASGTTLTLTSATVSGDSMYAVYLGRALQTVNPPNASVGNSQTAPTIITGQTAETSIATDDLILLSDTSASGALKKMTRANFVSGVGGNNQPYFTAYQTGNYSLSQNTATTIVLGNTTVNSGTDYNTSNGRFTPEVAGDYFVTATHSNRHGSSGNAVVLFESYIQKNGSDTNFRASVGNEGTSTVGQSVSTMGGIITMNGSSDYLTLSVTQYDYTGQSAQNICEIQFSAFKII